MCDLLPAAQPCLTLTLLRDGAVLGGKPVHDGLPRGKALHLAVGLALQRGGLVQRVRYRDQLLALVIAVIRALARAVRYRSTWARAFHHRYLDL